MSSVEHDQLEELVRKCIRNDKDRELVTQHMQQLRSRKLGTAHAIARIPQQQCKERMQHIPLGVAMQLHEEALRVVLEIEVVVVLEALGLLTRVRMPRGLACPSTSDFYRFLGGQVGPVLVQEELCTLDRLRKMPVMTGQDILHQCEVKCAVITSFASYHSVSYRVASHRIVSYRVVSCRS